MSNETTNSMLDTKYIVPCRAIDSQGKPIAGLQIQAYDQDPRIAHDPLGEPLITDADGMVELRYKRSDFTEHPGEKGPDIYFKIYRGNTLLQYNLPKDKNDNGVLRHFQPQRDPITIQVEKHYVVEGHILLANQLPDQGRELLIYNRGFGGNDILLGDNPKPKTNDRGYYVLTYNPKGMVINLEVRIQDPKDSQKEIPLSKPKFRASTHEVLNLVAPAEVLNLVAPATAPQAEYRRLAADLEPHIGNMKQLANAREAAERHDLTVLNRATEWDARLIALAATAVKLSSDVKLNADLDTAQQILYALFRVGLPSDKQQLARVSSEVVKSALGKANQAGIVALTDTQVSEAVTSFANFARTTRLAEKIGGTASSLADILSKAAQGNILNRDAKELELFAEIYLNHRGSPEQLWQTFADRLPQEMPELDKKKKIDGLKLQGKLAYLTLNNFGTYDKDGRTTVGLADSLQAQISSLDNLCQMLLEKDFHQRDGWKTYIKDLASKPGQSLEQLVPTTYDGNTLDERLDAYASDLARKVRLSYPTQVVEWMISKGDLDFGELKGAVSTFLNNAVRLGFELGRTPVDAFVAQHHDALKSIDVDMDNAIDGVKRLQRLYQITPTNEALKTLFDHEITSAHDVVAFSYQDFLDRFGALFTSQKEAELLYRKAQQVAAVTYGVFSAMQQLNVAPPLYAVAAPRDVREKAKEDIIKHYSTMGTLFGSLDFCECEHCQSVLSPAAYLVDLLQFLDPEKVVWRSFLDNWKIRHNNEQYMKGWNDNGGPYPGEKKKPYYSLTERRPDLPNLSLTCENTNTTMPYIDLVNEILEYYITPDEKRPAYFPYDTGDATTSELVAEPQNILPYAYDILEKEACYPLGLPFDLWLEMVRQFFAHFETPLWKLMMTLCPSDVLFASSPGLVAYVWADIFSEYLGTSPAEYRILTDANSLDTWFKLYGYKTEDEALCVVGRVTASGLVMSCPHCDARGWPLHNQPGLRNAKTLARRLGISYRELVDIICTSFVNPGLEALGILRKLQVDVHDVVSYFNNRDNLAYAEEREAFEERLRKCDKTYIRELEVLWNSGAFDQTLLLRDFAGVNNFNQTYLQFVNGQEAGDLVFLKLNLFVRLWKKLGWSIEETDHALQAFVPNTLLPLQATNIDSALRTALVYLSHLKALDEQLNLGKDGRLKLLTLWSDIPTTGKNSLYAQLFLTRDVLKQDSVFDHPLGQYLCYFDEVSQTYQPFRWDSKQPEDPATGNVSLNSHLLPVQEALGLKAEEIELILSEADLKVETAALSLANISLLYRYRLLAKSLDVTISDLIEYKKLTDIDPFKSLPEQPLDRAEAKLSDDYPYQTLQFIEVFRKVRESPFQLEDLNYLLRHCFGPAGKYRPNPDALLTLISSLAAGIRRIEAEHSVPADIASISDDLLRQKLLLMRSPDVVEAFFGYWTDSIEHIAIKDNVPLDQKLDPTTWEIDGVRISYDVSHERQWVKYRGVLTDTRQQSILSKLNTPVQLFAALLDTIAKQSQAQAMEFFSGKFDGILTYDDLYGTDGPYGITEFSNPEQIKQVLKEKRRKVLEVLLPTLRETLIRQFVVQTLVTILGSDATLTEALLTDEQLLCVSQDQVVSSGSPGDDSLLSVFKRTAQQGVTATFYNSVIADAVRHAYVLLTKTLLITASLGLSKREITYILKHRSSFDNLDLSGLPTREASPSAQEPRVPFKQFVHLIDYASLKRDLAPGTDDIITIFESNSLDDTYQHIATITRCSKLAVQAAAEQLALTASDFTQEQGLSRLWRLLQIIEKVGVSASKLVKATTIVTSGRTCEQRYTIACDIKNAIKARYDLEDWQRIVQPIFDKLRLCQRNALVAYIMYRYNFESQEELFEYFLIDSGMEPIVQTSRLRLAISSVQLFIQRCLLNLEPHVHPAAINSAHWQWMKHYRVWEASRKIFLFPENWLEPEFRDDKTHLFRELESTLLQGDISNGLAEDAFFSYLRKLEDLARLEIVAMCSEKQPLDPDSHIVHVIGRTYNQPRNYYYRRYVHRRWTPWEPVNVGIEDDPETGTVHLALAVWQERLHLFWVTFSDVSQHFPKDQNEETQLTPVGAGKRKKVLLNWGEYLQRQWTTRRSGGSGPSIDAMVSSDFDPKGVFIHVQYEPDGALIINLSGAVNVNGQQKTAFRLTSKNGQPEIVRAETRPSKPPYSTTSRQASGYKGSRVLKVTHVERIETNDAAHKLSIIESSDDVLSVPGDFTLLFSSDRIWLPTDVSFGVAPVIVPFFYQDNLYAFFVEPSYTQSTIEKYDGWVFSGPLPEQKGDDWWKQVPVVDAGPVGPTSPIDPHAKYQTAAKSDWVIHPETAIRYDEQIIVEGGELKVMGDGVIDQSVLPSVNISMITPGSEAMLNQAGFAIPTGGLKVIGVGGLNSAMLEQLKSRIQ